MKLREEICVNKDFKQGININNDFTEDPHAVAFQKCLVTNFFLNPALIYNIVDIDTDLCHDSPSLKARGKDFVFSELLDHREIGAAV